MEVYEVYEVLCDDCDAQRAARVFMFSSIDDAMAKAESLCKAQKFDVRVVRVIGSFTCDKPRWISAGVPGYK